MSKVRNAPGYKNRAKSSIIRPVHTGRYSPFCVLLEHRISDRELMLLEQLRVALG